MAKKINQFHASPIFLSLGLFIVMVFAIIVGISQVRHTQTTNSQAMTYCNPTLCGVGPYEKIGITDSTPGEPSCTSPGTPVHSCVSYLQEMLKSRICLDNNGRTLVVDGVFGIHTYQALIKYQYAVGITRDGIAGPRTWLNLTTQTLCL